MSPIISAKGGLSSQGYGQFASTGTPYTLVGNYDALATVTVPSGGLSSITFAGIPSTYTHLQIRAFVKTNRSTYGRDEFFLRFNDDSTSSNYSWHTLYGDGGTAAAYAAPTESYIDAGYISGGVGTSMFGAAVVDILDYKNPSKYKTTRSLTGHDHNGAIAGIHAIVNLNSGLWKSTSAINSIKIAVISGTAFNEYSSFALYGVK